MIKEFENDLYNVANRYVTVKEIVEKWGKYISREVTLDSWKGKDKITIEQVESDWLVIEHRKDKHSEEIKEIKRIIPNKNVDLLRRILQNMMVVGGSTKYIDIVEELMDYYEIHIDLSAFNGGLNRNKHYFPKYYYPMKVLESLGEVKFGKKITRLK